MTATRNAPAFASDDWMLEQQMRAELEAEAWRRLREQLTPPLPAPPAPEPAPRPAPLVAPTVERIERGGSILLKALVRFALATFGAYLIWVAAMDGGLGEFEIWLATGTGFIVTLCLTMFDPVRHFVHLAAEATRWVILVAVGLGVAWLLTQMSA